MKIDNVQVFGFKSALRGMRNPLESWNKSDSYKVLPFDRENYIGYKSDEGYQENYESFFLGEADKILSQKLTKAGSEHCKFLRQIMVWADLDLPRNIWSEFDTYQFVVKNSESTMHTAHRRYLTQEDFEYGCHDATLKHLNYLIDQRKNGVISSNDFIEVFKNALPEGFLQMRTISTNYAQLLNIYLQRHNHRLQVWRDICEWILTLPYFKELTGINKEIIDESTH